MNKIQKLVLNALINNTVVSRNGIELQFDSNNGKNYSSDSWIMSMSICKYSEKISPFRDKFPKRSNYNNDDEHIAAVKKYFEEEEDCTREDFDTEEEYLKALNEYMRIRYEYKNSYLSEGIPTHVCRIVGRTESYLNGSNMLNLVDGGDIYLIINEKEGTVESIWEGLWEGDQPQYYGGHIYSAVKWVKELGIEFYRQLGNPFKGDRDKNLTLSEYKEYEERANQPTKCDICGTTDVIHTVTLSDIRISRCYKHSIDFDEIDNLMTYHRNKDEAKIKEWLTKFDI